MKKEEDMYYFRAGDEMAYSLEEHLRKAEEDGMEELELFKALPSEDKYYVWCRDCWSSVEKSKCTKAACDSYRPSRKGRGAVCVDRFKCYEAGEKETFKIR